MMTQPAFRPRLRLTAGVILAIVVTLVATACAPFSNQQTTITAYLPDSSGLFEGNDVGILGVPVGSITKITPQGDQVKVEMSVNSDQKVPADAGAVVVSRSVATDRYIELTPVYHSGPTMKSGAVIAAEKTKTPVDFDAVLASLNTLAKGLAGTPGTEQVVGETVNNLSEAIGDQGPLIHQTIGNVAAAVDGLSGQRDNFSATVKSLDQLTTTLADNQQTVSTFIDQVHSAATMLNEEKENYRKAIRQLAETIQMVAEFVKTNRPALKHWLTETTKLMESVLSRRDSLHEAMQVFPLALQNMARTSKGGKLNVDMPLRNVLSVRGIAQVLCSLTQPPGSCGQLDPLLEAWTAWLDTILGLGERP